ncbi:hypothetical protein P5705_00650 [Pseudomonas entomophila]|uniref:hypothetical protein n=1 Tax=Pseudomonas entomophila TaxID=312306 RepID=UPI002406F077|nr:hypothetical protein [Pseudomonas entomophila]MDF9616142.1 hypothetical protein [Pseudomonas entomophila]
MGFEIINMGAAPTGVGGDTVRTGFDKVNRNLALIKDRALQANYSPLSGQLYREVGVAATHNITSGFTLRTNIPAEDGVAPLIRLHGCVNGYTSPITIDLSWYFYLGKVNTAVALVNTTSQNIGSLATGAGLKISIFAENGKANLYFNLPMAIYLPRFAVSCINTGALSVDNGLETGWTVVFDGPAPASNLVQAPFTVVTTLNTANCKVGNDGTIKVA